MKQARLRGGAPQKYGIMCYMEKTRPILYGVADYAEIRRAGAWFLDRTAKIRDL